MPHLLKITAENAHEALLPYLRPKVPRETKTAAEIETGRYKIRGKSVSALAKYNELVRFKTYAWKVFDDEDNALFNELSIRFAKKPKSSRFGALLKQMLERESDREEQVRADPGKQTLVSVDKDGNVFRYQSELDDFQAAEKELFAYNYRRARNGTLLAPDGSRIENFECEGGTHREKVRTVEAEAATGSTTTKLDSGFPVLSAIRKKDGNIVQESKGDKRLDFEAIAQLLRLDFAAANRDCLSKPIVDGSFDHDEVDYSNDGKHAPDAPLVVAQREKTSMETITHVDPKTGEVWTGEVPTFVNDGVRQIRGDGMAWTWLDLEVSPHQYDYKKRILPGLMVARPFIIQTNRDFLPSTPETRKTERESSANGK